MALALIVGVPVATPVTGTNTEVDPPGMVTDKGTVAAPVVEPSETISPAAGAGAERSNTRFVDEPALTAGLIGKKVMV